MQGFVDVPFIMHEGLVVLQLFSRLQSFVRCVLTSSGNILTISLVCLHLPCIVYCFLLQQESTAPMATIELVF